MEYTDLTPEERLVLVALLDSVIMADGEYSEEESNEVVRISTAIGLAAYQAAARQARAELPTLGALKPRVEAITRLEARELILTAVQDMAVVDEVTEEEQKLVEWLSELWGY